MSRPLMMLVRLTLSILVCGGALICSARAEMDALARRKGAEQGAKPCAYEAVPRPSVLVTPERLERVRQEVRQHTGERRLVYLEHVRTNADRWLGRTISVPEVGGWGHDFFCTDGTQLELPANQQFGPEPSRCPACGRTYLNDKILAARRFHEHYWLAGAVRDLALAYAIEQKGEYAKRAAEILIRYADAYPNRLGGPGGGGFQGMALTEAVSLIPMAQGYDLIFQTLSPAQRAHIEQDLFWPAAQSLSGFGLAAAGNHGSWHISAIGVIGYVTRHQRFIELATRQFKTQIADVLGDDGLWPESVHTYHFYPLDGFLALAEAATNSGDDLYSWEAKPGKSLKLMFTAALRYAYPNLRLAAINDGWYDAFLPQDQYTLAYYRYRLPEFAWVIQELRRTGKSGVPGEYFDQHYRNLLYGEPLPSQLQKPALASRDFPGLGIAVLRQEPESPARKEMMLTLDYGRFLGHGHLDKMGVTLFAQGKLLAPDYGTSGYGVPLSQFLQSTRAHNTIVIDGKNQKPVKDGNLVAFKDTPNFKLAAARTSELVDGVSWTRTVMLADEYAVIWDAFESREEHQYDWLFHAEGKSLLLEGARENPIPTTEPVGGIACSFITEITSPQPAGPAGFAQWTSDDERLGVSFLTSPGQQAFTAKFATPEARQVPLLGLRQKGRRVDFVAVLRPGRQEEMTKAYRAGIRRAEEGVISLTVPAGKQEDRISLANAEVLYHRAGTKPISVLLPPSEVAAARPASLPTNLPPVLPAFRYRGVVLSAAALKYRPQDDIIYPAVVRMEGHVPNPPAKYVMYYAPHNAPGGICLAYADALAGPWREYTNNPIINREWAPHYRASHVSGPDVIWNEEAGKLFLYFHGENGVTRLASSGDGVHFDYEGAVLTANMFEQNSEASYGRVFRYTLPGRDNRYVMLLMGNQHGTRRIFLAWSKDGRNWESRRKPILDPPPGTDQVAGAIYLSRAGRHFLLFHANNSKLAFNEGYDLYVAETDAAFEHPRHLGKFLDRSFVAPNNPGVMSPTLVLGDGRLHMFFNIGPRLRNQIALAIEDDRQMSAQKAMSGAGSGQEPSGSSSRAALGP